MSRFYAFGSDFALAFRLSNHGLQTLILREAMEQDTTFLRLKATKKSESVSWKIVSDYQVRFQAMQGVGTKIINPL